MDKNLNNLLDFEDFEKNWKSKEQKSTKRTDVGLDILNEEWSMTPKSFLIMKYDKSDIENLSLSSEEVIEIMDEYGKYVYNRINPSWMGDNDKWIKNKKHIEKSRWFS